MYLVPLMGRQVRPVAISSIRQTRTLKPCIKIGKERFELTLDLRNYNRDEITVKAHPDYVTIEGKQERKTSQGCLMSQFLKRYRLPGGCKIDKMESRLSPDGILTISAPRLCCEPDVCNTIVIPIKTGDPPKKTTVDVPPPALKKPKEYDNPCDAYLKIKPKKMR